MMMLINCDLTKQNYQEKATHLPDKIKNCVSQSLLGEIQIRFVTVFQFIQERAWNAQRNTFRRNYFTLLYEVLLSIYGFVTVWTQACVSLRVRSEILNEANGQHVNVTSRYHRNNRRWELQNIRTESKRKMMIKHTFSETNQCHLLDSNKAEYSATDLHNWHIEIRKWDYSSKITTTTATTTTTTTTTTTNTTITTTTTTNNNNNNNNADRIF